MSKGGGTRRLIPAAGFTLLELLVVLSIMAVALAVAIPAANPSRRALTLKASALGLSTYMKAVHSAAMNLNVERTLLVDMQRKLYWVEGSAKAGRIAPELALSAQVAPRYVVSPATVRFRFHPDGTSSGGAVTMRDGSRTARVAVDWRTGSPRVEWSR